MSKSGYPNVFNDISARRVGLDGLRLMYYVFVGACVLLPLATLMLLFNGKFSSFFLMLIVSPFIIWLLRHLVYHRGIELRKQYELRCPSCQTRFPISMPWRCVCGNEHPRLTVGESDSVWDTLKPEPPHILSGCAKCSREPSAMNCPHCGTVILLVRPAEGWDKDMVHKNCVMVGLETEGGYAPGAVGARDPAADIRAHLDEK